MTIKLYVLNRILEQSGDIEVVAEAEDGEEAKVLIKKHLPDVAVLDIQMPKASGIEVTRWVRANLRGIGLLTLTAYDDTPYVMGPGGSNGWRPQNGLAGIRSGCTRRVR
jgi:DNA-binding NarL/FixJ family response regulator